MDGKSEESRSVVRLGVGRGLGRSPRERGEGRVLGSRVISAMYTTHTSHSFPQAVDAPAYVTSTHLKPSP